MNQLCKLSALWAGAMCLLVACGGGGGDTSTAPPTGGPRAAPAPSPAPSPSPSPAPAPAPSPSSQGTLTFARGGFLSGPHAVVDYDLASGTLTRRFTGREPTRTATGETVFLTPQSGSFPDFAITVADARGLVGAPLHVCRGASFGREEIGCFVPKLSPDSRLLAYGTRMMNADFQMLDHLVVRDRADNLIQRFEGFASAEWTPDGRLVATGADVRGAGVWASDPGDLGTLRRVDGNQVATPACCLAVSPDGRQVAFVWHEQLWTLDLNGQGTLRQLSQFSQRVAYAAWSPDGTTFAVVLADPTVGGLGFFRPGEPLVMRNVFTDPGDAGAAAPFGPISWR